MPTRHAATATDRLGSGGAVIHPRFLRRGPTWLAIAVAVLFGVSFATSFFALRDYTTELGFSPVFALAFPTVLDTVIAVLAIVLLLERALPRRTVRVRKREVALRLPTWPMLALWIYFAGSVAGNVAHAPATLPARLVSAVPPTSAMLTFHLLLRLLDRKSTLRAVAEAYEEDRIDESERRARRKARERAAKTGTPSAPRAETNGNSGAAHTAPTARRAAPNGHPNGAPRGTQFDKAWELYQARHAVGIDVAAGTPGGREFVKELEVQVPCSNGQARKLRSDCEQMWQTRAPSSVSA